MSSLPLTPDLEVPKPIQPYARFSLGAVVMAWVWLYIWYFVLAFFVVLFWFVPQVISLLELPEEPGERLQGVTNLSNEQAVELLRAYTASAIDPLVTLNVYLLTLLFAVRKARKLGVSLLRSGLTLPIDRRWLLAPVLFYITLVGVTSLLVAVLGEESGPSIAELQFPPTSPASFVFVLRLLVMVVAVPITEEILARGITFGYLRNRMGFWPAAILSSLLFYLIHGFLFFPTGFSQQIAAAFMIMGIGVSACWMFERSGSLWPGIILHALTNAVTLMVLAGASFGQT